MKSKITLPALFVLTIIGFALACKKDKTSTPPVASDVNLKKGLLVYLPFDGNMADSSGNANTTTPVAGAALTFDEHGYSNSAFGGTGNGEKLLVTNNGSIAFDTAYTLSYDFMVRNTNLQAYVSMVKNIDGTGPTFISGTTNANSGYFEFSAVDSTAGCSNIGQAASTPVISTFSPEPDSWYNFVGIYHKGIVQIYINGKLIAAQTGAVKKANLCSAAQLVVGGWWSNDAISINGKLDEVRLYNRVLNADEIAELSKNFQAD